MTLKKPNNRTISIIGIIILVLGWFYWFQLRPSNIKKVCSIERQQKYDGVKNDIYELNEAVKFQNQVYENCLHNNGL
jgi:hypothetical protein